jgi:phosphomannomutase
VDEKGEEINRKRLIALISAILLSENPACSIVTDSVTSDGLAKFITARGGKHIRFKRGYKNVINEAIRRNQAGEFTPLAIETSGHAALMENYFLDDGAYLITRLLIAMANAAKEGKNLTDLIATLQLPVEEKELRVKFVPDCDFKTLGKKVIEDFTQYAQNVYYATPAEDNYEGYRLRYDEVHGDGWALIRMSLHDPILPINVESDSEGGAIKIIKDLYYFLKKYEFLNLAPFENAIAEWRQGKLDIVKEKIVARKAALKK